MKKQKIIVLLALILFVVVGCPSAIWGQDLATTKKNLTDFGKRLDTFISKTEDLTKKNKAQNTKTKLDELNSQVQSLTAESVKTPEDKKKLQDFIREYNYLLNEFNPSTGIPRPNNSQPSGNSVSDNNVSQNSPKPTQSSDLDKELKELSNKVGQLEIDSAPAEFSWLKLGLIVLGIIIVLSAIMASIFLLRRNKQRERDEIARTFGDSKRRYTELVKEINDLGEVSKHLSQQLAQQKSEIMGLKQASQNAASNAPSMPVPPISSPPREEAAFPVAVDEYLARSKNGGTIPVKYDYKERMLVQDDAREGGLLIVRDGAALNLVPSFGFFQTKSDYTNYFERYYFCVRPASGGVWIRQPATVKQINGGWQLQSQGELEVR